MVLDLSVRTVPLQADEAGCVQVVGTRIPLERIVVAFSFGVTPEEIVQQYPTLSLRDTYAVIAYYLENTAAVDEYVRERSKAAADMRAEVEKIQAPQDIRARLLRRRRA